MHNLKKRIICLFLAAVLCFCTSACGKKDAPTEAPVNNSSDSSAQNEAAQKNTESNEKKYRWDINGDMQMHWETNDNYLQYVEISDEACPMVEDDGKIIVSMKSIFPSWTGWQMDGYYDTKLTPYHFEASADLGETAKENDEYFEMWGSLAYLNDSEASADSVLKNSLDSYLSGDRAEDANEGTLVTTGLRTKEINGHTVMYVRMQFEDDHHLFKLDKDVTMFVQRTYAVTEVESSAKGVLYLGVMIDEFRMEPDVFSDDTIIDKIFENVIYGE